MNKFYVYAWLRPCGTPFYVGKGNGTRDIATKKHNTIFMRILDKIERSGASARVVRWHDGIAEDAAFYLERSYIRLFGRIDLQSGVLANLTDGGEGASGRVINVETLQKLSRNTSFRRDEVKAKISAFAKIRTYSTATRLKMSVAKLGKPQPDEVVRKRTEKLVGRVMTQSHLENLKASNRSWDPDVREKIRLSLIGVPHSQERRQNISAGNKMKPPKGEYKGVYTTGKSFGFRINADGSGQIRIGGFQAAKDAARAYDDAAVEAWGVGNCYLNFPDRYQHAAVS